MRETVEEERVEYHLCRLALHYYLLEPEGEPAIVPEREYEKGRRDENLFIYAFNLPKDLTLPHSSERGREILTAALQNKGLS